MVLLARELARRGFRVALVVIGSGVAPAGTTWESPSWNVRAWSHQGNRGACRSRPRTSIADGLGCPGARRHHRYSGRRVHRPLLPAASAALGLRQRERPRLRPRSFGPRTSRRLGAATLALPRSGSGWSTRLSSCRALRWRSPGDAFPSLKESKVVFIPYFAEEFSSDPELPAPTAFVWAGRLAEQKRPLLYPELAESVPSGSFTMIPLVPPNASAQDEARLEELTERAGVFRTSPCSGRSLMRHSRSAWREQSLSSARRPSKAGRIRTSRHGVTAFRFSRCSVTPTA